METWKVEHPSEALLPPVRSLLTDAPDDDDDDDDDNNNVGVSTLAAAHAVGFMQHVLSPCITLPKPRTVTDPVSQPLWSPLAFHAHVNDTVSAMSRTVATGVLLLSPDAPY